MSMYDSQNRYVPPGNEVAAGKVSETTSVSAPTRAVLKAMEPAMRAEGMQAFVTSDRSRWVFSATSALADTSEELVLTPSSGSGRWLRADHSFVMKLAVDYTKADAAVLLTVPEGFAIRLITGAKPWWEVTTAFTGGSSSAIGISSSLTGLSTKGDILGGAAGDVLAMLDAGLGVGTTGAGIDTAAEQTVALLKEGDTIRFDRITSVFTAGAGFACIPVVIVANSPATP
jgi:hypothetical protein